MKTSKAMSKPVKISGDKEVIKGKKIAFSKTGPSEQEIREKAKEIYHQRIDRGEYGTEVDDWLEAEECLKDSEG